MPIRLQRGGSHIYEELIGSPPSTRSALERRRDRHAAARTVRAPKDAGTIVGPATSSAGAGCATCPTVALLVDRRPFRCDVLMGERFLSCAPLARNCRGVDRGLRERRSGADRSR